MKKTMGDGNTSKHVYDENFRTEYKEVQIGASNTKSKITKGKLIPQLSHLGYDITTGNFDANNISPDWKQLLNYVGVTNEELKNKGTAIFIYDFVENHGGIQAAYKLFVAESTAPAPPIPPKRRSSVRELPDIPPPLIRRDSKPLPPLPPRGVQVLPPPTLPIGKEELTTKQLKMRLEEAEMRTKEYKNEAEELNKRVEHLERLVDESDAMVVESNKKIHQLEKRLAESNEMLEQLKGAHDEQWVIQSEEIDLTGPEIGRGGWATVSVANFKGAPVAVKRIHDQIICRRNKELFRREMVMAARLRHPNLVQFIGATIQGEMMIVMEYIPTSLRKQLEADEYFPPQVVRYVSLDITRALNYLHQIQPSPMIHRDISSANVLLEPLLPPKSWKAKITDYGSVNLVHQLNTENPGSPVYSAPEARFPSQQSPKMDIYSLGVLLLEMLTGQLVAPENRSALTSQVHYEKFLGLIRRCLAEEAEDRPSACDIITELL